MRKIKIRSKTFNLFATSTLCAIFITACAVEETPAVKTPLTAEQKATSVLNWWNGNYNNDRQIAELREDGVPIWINGQTENKEGVTFGGFLPVTSYYRTIDLPAFGEKVMYLEEFTFKENPYRQRIYTVIHDTETDVVRVKLWYFKDKEKYRGAWKDLSMIQDLTPDDMSPLPDNCDLYVTENENRRLDMKMPKDQCKFGESIFDYQVSLSADDFWYRDRIVDATTMKVKMTAGMFGYHILDKLN